VDNRAGEMQVFLRVVEAGSLSAAARALMMTPSTVSKLVSRIEARLGVRLLERSTRRLSLTAEGRVYYEKRAGLLAQMEEVERDLADGAASAGGTVRVNASVAFGVFALEPLLPEFWRAHPHILLDMSLSDEIVDLYLDRTDVAFRIGALAPSSMMARRIGSAWRRIVASPDYLARCGTPVVAEDLGRHNCLGFNFRRASSLWPVEGAGPAGTLLANNGDTLRRMAVAGVGLARLADFHVREDIAAGRLVEVLADAVARDEEPVHALYLGGPHLPQRIRMVLDFMAPRLQAYLA
jgi:DNA-binding transcriptional LysR family regulator